MTNNFCNIKWKKWWLNIFFEPDWLNTHSLKKIGNKIILWVSSKMKVSCIFMCKIEKVPFWISKYILKQYLWIDVFSAKYIYTYATARFESTRSQYRERCMHPPFLLLKTTGGCLTAKDLCYKKDYYKIANVFLHF